MQVNTCLETVDGRVDAINSLRVSTRRMSGTGSRAALTQRRLAACGDAGRHSIRRRLRSLCQHLVPKEAASPGGVVAPVPNRAAIMTITPLVDLGDGYHFGARVENVDLAAITQEQWLRIQEAWFQYALLVFPNQGHLTPTDEVDFYARIPGCDPTERNWSSRHQIPEAPQITVIGHAQLEGHHGLSGIEVTPTGMAPQWHVDGSFAGDVLPPAATQMYCVQAPGELGAGELHAWPESGKMIPYQGGATIFADMRLAYRLLSTDERELVESLEVAYFGFGRSTGEDIEGGKFPQLCPLGIQPLVAPKLKDVFKKHDPTDVMIPGWKMGGNRSATMEKKKQSGKNWSHDPPSSRIHGGHAEVDEDDDRRHTHPFVWRHPRTGIPATMAHTLVMQHMQRIRDTGTGAVEQWSWSASEAKVKEIIAPALQPEMIYCHNWVPGDLCESSGDTTCAMLP
jgi:alpha-ketoglutarate-dependent taurine dioxygenase